MKKQINCMHYIEKAKRTSVYSYDLINAELNLCQACEKKLRKAIFKQDKIEKEMKGLFKKNGRNKTNN